MLAARVLVKNCVRGCCWSAGCGDKVFSRMRARVRDFFFFLEENGRRGLLFGLCVTNGVAAVMAVLE